MAEEQLDILRTYEMLAKSGQAILRSYSVPKIRCYDREIMLLGPDQMDNLIDGIINGVEQQKNLINQAPCS